MIPGGLGVAIFCGLGALCIPGWLEAGGCDTLGLMFSTGVGA